MGSRDMVQTMVWGRCSLQAMDGSGEMAPVAKMLNHIAGKYCKYSWQCYALDINIANIAGNVMHRTQILPDQHTKHTNIAQAMICTSKVM